MLSSSREGPELPAAASAPDTATESSLLGAHGHYDESGAGFEHSVALTISGKVYTFGFAKYEQPGIGSSGGSDMTFFKTNAPFVAEFVEIAEFFDTKGIQYVICAVLVSSLIKAMTADISRHLFDGNEYVIEMVIVIFILFVASGEYVRSYWERVK